MRVLVIGVGAIGTRHIRNLLSLGTKVSAYCYRTFRAQDLSREFNIHVYNCLEQALDSDQDAVLICNRTDQHITVALAAAARGLHLFIEKPLSHSMEGVERLFMLVRERQLVVEVGCMMRFHPNLLWIRNAIREGFIGQVYFARAVVGQYLPDWRPDQDYRLSYSARHDQGGGVVLDLVHELDYLTWWFGEVEDVAALLRHLSDLEISSEDTAQILLSFRSGVMAEVHMDYLRPNFYRFAEVVGSRGMLTWNSGAGTVTLKRKREEVVVHKIPSKFERNSMFVDHMRHFVKRLSDPKEAAVSLAESIHVQRVALAAHLSSKSRAFVRPATVGAFRQQEDIKT